MVLILVTPIILILILKILPRNINTNSDPTFTISNSCNNINPNIIITICSINYVDPNIICNNYITIINDNYSDPINITNRSDTITSYKNSEPTIYTTINGSNSPTITNDPVTTCSSACTTSSATTSTTC